MRRLLACLLMFTILGTGIGTAAGAEVIPQLPLGMELLGKEDCAGKYIETYRGSIPEDGTYLELKEFSGEQEAGTVVTVTGIWGPSYASLAVEFYADDGTATLGFLRSGETNVFHLRSSSTWHVHVRAAEGDAASGTIQLTIA